MQIYLKKIDQTVDVDITRFKIHVNDHIYQYGLRQILADSYASGKDDAERKSLFQKRLDTLYRGDLRAERESNPLAVEITRLAAVQCNKHFVKQGVARTKIPADDWKAKMAEWRADERIVALATKNVASLEELPDID